MKFYQKNLRNKIIEEKESWCRLYRSFSGAVQVVYNRSILVIFGFFVFIISINGILCFYNARLALMTIITDHFFI